MPLDDQTRRLLNTPFLSGTPVFDALVMRKIEARSLPPLEAERALLARVVDQEISGPLGLIPLRIYHPKPADLIAEPPPLLIYFHGGGNVIGSLDSHDGVCCQLARQSGCLVVSVDYRLAPEYKFPAAPEECYAAVQWIAANGAMLGGNPARLAVAGDSAGGNLAAVVCLLAKERAGPSIAYQVLIYPSTTGRAETASRQRNGRGYFLTIELMDWFASQYFEKPEDKRHPHYAVLRATSHTGLPPALIVTAEFDPLLDDGELYAKCLSDAGVPVEYLCYKRTIHGFVSFYPFIDKGKDAITRIAIRLREKLACE